MHLMPNIILDLDNTIYPVKSIAAKLFAPLFNLLQKPEHGLTNEIIRDAGEQIMRIPFQKVAIQFGFSATLTHQAINLLQKLTYNDDMIYFDGYEQIRALDVKKFLLTTGFRNLQESKIRSLGIHTDFTEIFVIDPSRSNLSKKDVMEHIMEKYQLTPKELIVIGDDPESEINAAYELGIASFLIDPESMYLQNNATYTGRELREVLNVL